MTAHFRRILHQRRQAEPLPDIERPVRAAADALPFDVRRIPLESDVPGGRALHETIARMLGRQTTGALQQVQRFAQPVQAALEALMLAVAQLNQTLQVDVAQSLDALYERQAAQERAMAAAGLTDRRVSARPFQTGYSRERFEETFRGSREEILERYRDLAERLVGCSPVLDIGCGRGEFLELLNDLGVEARGVDIDGDVVETAVGRNLNVDEEDGFRHIGSLEDGSLGGSCSSR